MFIDFRERKEESERERENINWLPPTRAPTEDQTCNLLWYGTTLQVTEQPGQGKKLNFNSLIK